MKILLNKFIYFIFMLFLISAISFFAIHLAPNSLFSAGELNPNMTQEALSRLKSIYGLDKTLIESRRSDSKGSFPMKVLPRFTSITSITSGNPPIVGETPKAPQDPLL